MDTLDVPGTPEWGRAAGLSDETPSMSTSSNRIHPPSSPNPSPRSHATEAASSETSMATSGIDGSIDPSHSIIPFETSECERLTVELRSCLQVHDSSDVPPSGLSAARQSDTLKAALDRASSAIKNNAKWFLTPAVGVLLNVALQAASRSSSSAVLYASLELIDTIGTYSLLPSRDCLVPSVQFIAATYYSASRANKTKKLADKAWTSLQRILASHLGKQCVVALLAIIADDNVQSRTRIGYAQVTGVMMLITDHFLFKEGPNHLPTVSASEVLRQVRFAALKGGEHTREYIMQLITKIMAEPHSMDKMANEAGLDDMIDIIRVCVAHAPSTRASQAVVESMQQWIPRLEPRHVAMVARLCVEVDLPLTPQLHKEIVSLWQSQLLDDRWLQNLDGFMRRLCTSPHYPSEVASLTGRSLDVFLASEDSGALKMMLGRYQRIMSATETDPHAAAVIGKELVGVFKRCASEDVSLWKHRLLFETLCDIANRSVDAAKLLLRLRADVRGTVYFRADYASPDPKSQRDTGLLYNTTGLPIEKWHTVLLSVYSEGAPDWATYDCYLTSFTSLLSNHKLFEATKFIKDLFRGLCDQFARRVAEPPAASGLTKTYVVFQHIQMLTVMISYHRNLSKVELTHLISIFLSTAGSGDHVVSIHCIHALTICCYEIPGTITSYIDDIIDKMSKIVTQRFLAIHVLQFIAGLSRLPDLHRNFTVVDYKRIFGVCQSYLQPTRGTTSVKTRKETPTSDRSSGNRKEEALPEYVYALAHHVITFWYLSLNHEARAGLKPFITSCLTCRGPDGEDVLEDQGMVTIDMMDRTDAEAVDEMLAHDGAVFDETDGRLVERHRLVGLLLISTQTALRTGRTLVTVRRPSGTSQRLITKGKATITVEAGDTDLMAIMDDTAHGKSYGCVAIPRSSSVLGSPQILTLDGDDAVKRAIQSFDRTSGLDSHKAGVIYIGERQVDEDRILRNISGSPDYREFLRGLGMLQPLKGATFNTQGLDRAENADGEHTIVWNNDVTEVVFHVTTMMPNVEDVRLNTANKKRHIGNDHVNIVFNNSGESLDFTALHNMFPGQLTFVYILIAPSARTSFVEARTENVTMDKKDRFYRVKVVARPDYPNVSPAEQDKVVSGASLPGFVRSLVLNDCIISLMWSPRNDSSEYPSSWRYRMDQLKRMGQRYGKA